MPVLQKPYFTSKAASLNKKNKYCFIVDKKATKPEIKKAVKALYGAEVKYANTMCYPSKNIVRHTRKGMIKGSKAGYKKVIVSLAPGNTIDLLKP